MLYTSNTFYTVCIINASADKNDSVVKNKHKREYMLSVKITHQNSSIRVQKHGINGFNMMKTNVEAAVSCCSITP